MASSPSSGQDPSAAWSSASRSAARDEDRPILDPPGRNRGVEGRREDHAGQPLVAERAVAAVMIPVRRPDQPARRVGQGIRGDAVARLVMRR